MNYTSNIDATPKSQSELDSDNMVYQAEENQTGSLPALTRAGQESSKWAYRNLLLALPKRSLFLLSNLIPAIAACILLVTMFALSLSLAVIIIGILLLPTTLLTARYFGSAWRKWTSNAEGKEILAPFPPTSWSEKTTIVSKLFLPLKAKSDWKALLHQGLINFAVTLFTWVISLTWLSAAIGGPTYWIWGVYLPYSQENVYTPGSFLLRIFSTNNSPASLYIADSLSYLLLGLFFAITLPYIYAALTKLHWDIANFFLGVTSEEHLRQEVDYLSASRLAALEAEGLTLSNLERDLHDGPQQRLVRLQMDLDSIGRRIETNPEAASHLVTEARQSATEALAEIRAISRGFAPPILEEKGLQTALLSLGAGSPIPTKVEIDYEGALPTQVERNTYYVASELLTNINKHSRASSAQLQLFIGYDNHEGEINKRLILQLTDNGVGGINIDAHPQGGLEGLRKRLQGIDGTLEVNSPEGGPTTVRAIIPIPRTLIS